MTSHHSALDRYTIEPTDTGYLLFGVRGTFALVRHTKRTSRMWVVNRKTGKITKIGGHAWWTDKTGVLRPIE